MLGLRSGPRGRSFGLFLLKETVEQDVLAFRQSLGENTVGWSKLKT